MNYSFNLTSAPDVLSLTPIVTSIPHIRCNHQIDLKMKSMNRQFGKLMSKGQGDNAKVSMLIADYEDADKTLTKVGALPMTRFC